MTDALFTFSKSTFLILGVSYGAPVFSRFLLSSRVGHIEIAKAGRATVFRINRVYCASVLGPSLENGLGRQGRQGGVQ